MSQFEVITVGWATAMLSVANVRMFHINMCILSCTGLGPACVLGWRLACECVGRQREVTLAWTHSPQSLARIRRSRYIAGY